MYHRGIHAFPKKLEGNSSNVVIPLFRRFPKAHFRRGVFHFQLKYPHGVCQFAHHIGRLNFPVPKCLAPQFQEVLMILKPLNSGVCLFQSG